MAIARGLVPSKDLLVKEGVEEIVEAMRERGYHSVVITRVDLDGDYFVSITRGDKGIGGWGTHKEMLGAVELAATKAVAAED